MNDEELLIFTIQGYNFLYDLEDPRYSNQLTRENAWEEIGQKIKYKSLECKNRWRSLRDCYRRALQKRQTKSGQAGRNQKPWKYEKQMEFVRRYVQCNREGRSNITIPPHSNVPEQEQALEATPRRPTAEEDSPASIASSAPIRRKRTPGPVYQPAAAVLKEYLNYKKEIDKKADHLSKYFSSVEETVRTFPPQLQIKIKSEISQIVHNAEYEAICYDRSGGFLTVNSPQTVQNEESDQRSPMCCLKHVPHTSSSES